MKRFVLASAICLAALGLVPVGASAATLDSYCSPTGDYCTFIERTNGKVFMSLRTFSFSGQYELCVKAPGIGRECKEWSLKTKPHSIYASRIAIGHYAMSGPGRYTVSWFYGGSKLGRGLHFGRG